MRHAVWVMVAAALAVGVATRAWAEDKRSEMFGAQKCDICHSLKSAGIQAKAPKPKGPDLSGIGAKHEAEWIRGYLRQEVTLGDKKHPAPFKGTDAELKAFADWLAGQK